MSCLLDLYYDFIKANNYSPRKGIEETLKYIENGHNVILRAPTGYGKTTLTAILANAVAQGCDDFASRVIHVLPFRAIVQDLYLKLEDYAKGQIVKTKSIGAQDMDYHDSPYFMRKVNVTTLDTFILNLFKLPAVELKQVFQDYGSHFEFPRAMIYSSIVLFDEFHLLGEEGKSLTAGLAALEVLKEAGVPVIVMSATIDDGLKKVLEESLGSNTKTVNPTDYNVNRDITVNFPDTEEKALETAERKLKEGKRVLITYNTRKGAIEAYKKLKDKGLSPLLIHSKFNRIDRTEKVKKIVDKEADKRANLVISTQVIEAGIDTTFDVLITEEAPSHNLIQRAGRVARYGGKGEVYIFPFSGKVYDEEEVKETSKRVKEEKTINERVLLKRNYKDQIQYTLLHDLGLVDTSVFMGSKAVRELHEEVCSITRDASIILGFPPEAKTAEEAIPLTEEEAIRIIKKKGDSAYVFGTEHKPGYVKLNGCLQLEFLKYNILGVRIEGYNSEMGGML